MKLLKCHIENFGKLKNFNYEFQDGLNTIKEENGFGKTTFANFIKAMFYGLETKRSTKVLIDRKKYTPWQGGIFGGTIEFEVNNKRYKVERTFGTKEADDTFKLYDLSTNLECNDFSKNLGEEIFKLNKEAYERSTFVAGQNMQTSMNDSINAKLGNILESENDINTSEQALKILDEAIKTYKKTGGRGELNEKISEKTILEKKLEQSRIDEKTLQERKLQNEEIKKQIKEKEKEQQKYKNILKLQSEEETKKAKFQNYKILKTNEEESRKKLNSSEEFFKPGIPTDEDIETLIEKCLSIERFKVEVKNYEMTPEETNEIEKLKRIFKDTQISEQDINKKIQESNYVKETKNQIEINNEKINSLNKEKEIFEKQSKNKKILNLILYLVSIVLIVIGILMQIKNANNINYVVVGTGIFLFVLGAIKSILLNKRKKELVNKKNHILEIQKSQEDMRNEVDKVQRNIENFINQYSDDEINADNIIQLTEIKANYIKYKDLRNSIDNLFEKQNEIMKKLHELEDSIKDYLLKYFETLTENYSNYAQEIKMKKNEFLNQKKDYEEKSQALKKYKNENNVEELNDNNNTEGNKIDKEELEKEIGKFNREIDELNDQKNYNKNQIEILESNLDSAYDIENDIEAVNQSIEEIKHDCDILEKTKKYLEIAKNQFSSHYLSGMQQSFIKNIKQITEKEIDINFDVNLDVKVNEQGSSKKISFFSTGYTDLIYVCMRLSLIDALFQDEKPFIILDDPFVNLDESKINNALELLNNISSKYQVIYFVCHESRK